jgi:polyhydroxybutyrate depolymerase
MLAACSSDPAAPSGAPTPSDDGNRGADVDVDTTDETFTFGGATRSYILSVPVDYDAGKTYPLVLEMHGNPGTAAFMLQNLPFDRVSRREAIVVYAQAAGTDWDLATPADQNDDMAYLRALVDEVASKLSIDKQRVLGTGWSGGAFMASQTACRLGGLFKAIAILSGGAPYESSDGTPAKDGSGFLSCPGGPVATLVIHGENDGVVSRDSGEYAAAHWAHVNGCGSTLAATTPAPCQRYAGCPQATPVQLCMIPGQDHGVWREGFAATWAFFESLP